MKPTQDGSITVGDEQLSDYWKEYERRVRAYEAQGMTRSDAQGVVDAEDMKSERAALAKAKGE